MLITKTKHKGCNKPVHSLLNERCGDWSLKHNEYYYCSECEKEFEPKKYEQGGEK